MKRKRNYIWLAALIMLALSCATTSIYFTNAKYVTEESFSQTFQVISLISIAGNESSDFPPGRVAVYARGANGVAGSHKTGWLGGNGKNGGAGGSGAWVKGIYTTSGGTFTIGRAPYGNAGGTSGSDGGNGGDGWYVAVNSSPVAVGGGGGGGSAGAPANVSGGEVGFPGGNAGGNVDGVSGVYNGVGGSYGNPPQTLPAPPLNHARSGGGGTENAGGYAGVGDGNGSPGGYLYGGNATGWGGGGGGGYYGGGGGAWRDTNTNADGSGGGGSSYLALGMVATSTVSASGTAYENYAKAFYDDLINGSPVGAVAVWLGPD